MLKPKTKPKARGAEKVTVAFRMTRPDRLALKRIALAQDMSVQALVGNCLKDMIRRGEP